VYLYLHDGIAELRDAAHLLAKTPGDPGAAAQGGRRRQGSVSCIGPAGENLVSMPASPAIKARRLHQRCGAVMGSKKLKAIVAHGKAAVPIHDKGKFDALLKQWWKEDDDTIWGMLIPAMGTSGQLTASASMGMAPVRNLTAYEWPEQDQFMETPCGNIIKEGASLLCLQVGHCTRSSSSQGPTKASS